MEAKKEKILIELGFQEITRKEFIENEEYFCMKPNYHYNARFYVNANHSYETVDILYIDNRDLKGFYYNSTLVDVMLEWNEIEVTKAYDILKEYLEVNLIFDDTVNGSYFIVECDLTDYIYAKKCVNEMIKMASVLDYFMKNARDEHFKKLFS